MRAVYALRAPRNFYKQIVTASFKKEARARASRARIPYESRVRARDRAPRIFMQNHVSYGSEPPRSESVIKLSCTYSIFRNIICVLIKRSQSHLLLRTMAVTGTILM